MRIIVTGAGRSGTNWTAAILRDAFDWFWQSSEDRKLFSKSLPDPYGSKLCTEWYEVAQLEELMDKYDDLKVVMCMRHPLSAVISKIVRGQTDGNNPPDSTVPGAIRALKHAYNVFLLLMKKYQGRYMVVFLEQLIKDLQEEILLMSKFCGFQMKPELMMSHSRTTNKYHQARYGAEIDYSQAYLYREWVDYISQQEVRLINNHLWPIMRTFDYEMLNIQPK